jgi:diguanylate cyclase (GGDEF)-like protein
LRAGRRVVRLTFAEAAREYGDRVDAEHDSLTHIYSASGFRGRVVRLLAEGPRQRKEEDVRRGTHVGTDDLTNFKRINDILDHVIGDEAIREAADELSETERLTDLLAVGRHATTGDEFDLVLGNVSPHGAIMFGHRFHGMQLEKVSSGRYDAAWRRIFELHSQALETHRRFEASVRFEPQNLDAPQEGEPRRYLYVNGERICWLRDIVVHAVGFSSEPLRSVDDLESRSREAEAVMRQRKAELHTLMGGSDRPSQP